MKGYFISMKTKASFFRKGNAKEDYEKNWQV